MGTRTKDFPITSEFKALLIKLDHILGLFLTTDEIVSWLSIKLPTGKSLNATEVNSRESHI